MDGLLKLALYTSPTTHTKRLLPTHHCGGWRHLGLGCVQREAVLSALEVGQDGHGVEVACGAASDTARGCTCGRPAIRGIPTPFGAPITLRFLLLSEQITRQGLEMHAVNTRLEALCSVGPGRPACASPESLLRSVKKMPWLSASVRRAGPAPCLFSPGCPPRTTHPGTAPPPLGAGQRQRLSGASYSQGGRPR